MAKPISKAPASKALATALARIYDIAHSGASGERDIVQMIKGSAPDALLSHREAFITGRLAAKLFARVNDPEAQKAKASDVLSRPNSKSKDAKRRTAEQDKIVNAARMAWSRLLNEAGVTTPNVNGGNKNAARKNKPKAETSPAAPIVPTIANETDWQEELLAEIARMESLLKKNGANLSIAQRKPFDTFILSARKALKGATPTAQA